MISALKPEPGIFSVTLVAGLATGFGTLMCHGSMLWLFGSAGGVCAAAAETAPKTTSVKSVGNAKVFIGKMIGVEAFQKNPADPAMFPLPLATCPLSPFWRIVLPPLTGVGVEA